MRELYEYYELSAEAQDNVKDWYYSCINTPDAFKSWLTGELWDLFPNSTLDAEPYNEDLRISGIFDLRDAYKWLNGDVSIKDYLWALPEQAIFIDIGSASNEQRYAADRKFMGDLASYAYWRADKRDPKDYDLLMRFFDRLYIELVNMVEDYQIAMVEFFTDDDDDMVEFINNNDIYFTRNGDIGGYNEYIRIE